MILALLVCLIVGIFLLPYWLISAHPFPKPSGKWHVGTTEFTWNLPNHSGIIAKIWYPSNAKDCGSSPYIDRLDRTLSAMTAGISPLAKLLLNKFYLGRIQTPSEADATLATRKASFPVILLSPGFGGINFLNSFYALEFASHGFMVIGINHPKYNSGTLLTDGSHVKFDGIDFTNVSLDRAEKLLAETITQQANNLAVVLDELLHLNTDPDSWLYQKIDPRRIFTVGHSTGGSASFLACGTDSRILKSVNLDGFLFMDRIDVASIEQEFLLILSNRDKQASSVSKSTNIFGALMAQDRTRIERFTSHDNVHKEIFDSASHWSFLDLALMINPRFSDRFSWFSRENGLALLSQTSATIIDFLKN